MPSNISNTGLAQFILQRFKEYKTEKDRVLTPKLQANLAAMECRDSGQKRKFKKGEGEGWRSDVYLPITKAKVYAVFSTLCDIELKGDTLPFSLKPSPYEEEFFEEDEELKAEADHSRELMEDKIREQLRDFGAVKEHKKKILSKTAYGMAWSKFDVKDIIRKGYRKQVMSPGWMGQAVTTVEKWEKQIKTPGYRYVSVWNMFWDVENEDIQKGTGIIERTMISPYEARQKENGYLYIKEHIRKVVAEFDRNKTASDSDTSDLTPGLREIGKRKRGMTDLEFWGRAPRKLVEQFEDTIGRIRKKPRSYDTYSASEFNLTTFEESDEDSGDDVEIVAEVIGEEVVRFARRDPKMRPYKLSSAELTLDDVQPSGVADNIDAVQYVGNGLVRGLLDNLRLASNVILAGKSRFLAGGKPEEISIGLWLELAESCQRASDAVQQVVIQDVGTSSFAALGLTDKWGDDFTNVPKIVQGSVLPKQKPDTAYELSQSLENAFRYLGALAKGDDDDFIKPEIEDIYHYNMEDPDIQEGKGNYVVHATGYQTLQNKMVLATVLQQLLALVMSIPEAKAEVKIVPHLKEIYKARDLDPDNFFKSEKEKQIEQQAMSQIQTDAAAAAEEQAQKAQGLKTEGEVTKIAAKSDADSKQKEEEFQRNVIMKAMEKAQNPETPKEVQ